jgi:hypothetical protein
MRFSLLVGSMLAVLAAAACGSNVAVGSGGGAGHGGSSTTTSSISATSSSASSATTTTSSSSSGGGAGGKPSCPAKAPALGSPCNDDAQHCPYDDGDPCTGDWICDLTDAFNPASLAWRADFAPKQDQACDPVGSTCYGDFGNEDCCYAYSEAVCAPSMKWDVMTFGGGPGGPANAGCPMVAPAQGDPCTGMPDAYQCIYSANAPCGATKATAYCKDKTWNVVPMPCAP